MTLKKFVFAVGVLCVSMGSAVTTLPPTIDEIPEQVQQEAVKAEQTDAALSGMAGALTRAVRQVNMLDSVYTLREDIVETAKRYIGCPYNFGSTGPRVFDCSGFTSYVFGLNSLSLTRNSRTQWQEGVKVDRYHAQPGDLVFFGKHGIHHVGIVVEPLEDGNFRFIHASTSRGVVIDEITSDYFAARFAGLKRIVSETPEEEI